MQRIFNIVITVMLVLVSTAPGLARPDFVCASVTDVPELECDALVALYNSTNGPGWLYRTNWLVATAVDDWYGVTVTDGHVTTLALIKNDLSGWLPGELVNLT